MGKKSNRTTLTPLKAIRAKCVECSAGNRREVSRCQVTSCPLYHLRSGHDPELKGKRAGNPNLLMYLEKARQKKLENGGN